MLRPDPAPVGFQPGAVLAGKYRVERVLGAGGMGVVVAAHHMQLDERVALKFLLPEALENPEAVARFLREARAVVKIKGEHVARVSDVGQLENGAPYIVMEYLEGSDLAGWLKQRGAMPVELAVDFILQACEAIADAHALGIVHRDLKPANLFCVQRSDGQLSIKVLDFGISKVMTPGASGGHMTRTSALVGSPSYMSPEQMQSSKGVDTRTDIWSLGVVLFELVTVRTPFEAEAVTELAIKIAIEPAPPLRAFRADVPPGLELAVATCLEKDRSRRFQTVGDLALALRDLGSLRARASVERILGTLRQAGLASLAPQPPAELHATRAATHFAPPASAPPPPAAWGRPSDLAPNSGNPATRWEPPALLTSAHSTDASWGQSSRSSRPGRGGKAMVGIVAAVMLVGVFAGGGWLLLRRAAAPAAMPSETAVASPLPGPSASAPPPAVTADSPPATAVSAPPLVASTPAAVVATHPLGRPSLPPSRPAVHAAGPPGAAAPSPAPKADCNPPYFFDGAGHKQYKSECM